MRRTWRFVPRFPCEGKFVWAGQDTGGDLDRLIPNKVYNISFPVLCWTGNPFLQRQPFLRWNFTTRMHFSIQEFKAVYIKCWPDKSENLSSNTIIRQQNVDLLLKLLQMSIAVNTVRCLPAQIPFTVLQT